MPEHHPLAQREIDDKDISGTHTPGFVKYVGVKENP